MKFHEILAKTEQDISKNYNFALRPPPTHFPHFVTQPQIEKLGKRYLRIVLRSSDMKFHKIWSSGCGEMASDEQIHRCMHRVATIICSPETFRGA